MFAHIRRHQKWLWVVIATVVIISFVVFMDRSGTGGRAGGNDTVGSVNGRSLSRTEVQDLFQEARIRYRLFAGRWPGQDQGDQQFWAPDQQLLERVVLADKIRRLGIEADDEAVAAWIVNVFRDRRTGKFSEESYRQFVNRELPQATGFSPADFRQFIAREVAMNHLVRLGSLSGGFLPPREAEAAFQREHETAGTEVVLFSLSNHLAAVTLTPAALSQFYSNNLSRYRVPEQVVVSYARFDRTNFLAEADKALGAITNLSAALDEAYQRMGADYFTGTNGKPLPPAEAKERIRQQEHDNQAITAARRKASEFAEELFALFEKEPQGKDLLARLAAAKGAQTGVTAPFGRFDEPKGLNVAGNFSEIAFALSAEQPMASEPVVGNDAVYVVAFKEKIPSRVQAFDEVRDRVTEEYRREQALAAARKAGEAFVAALTNAVAQGKAFEAVCAAEKVKPVNLPPFSQASTSLPGAPAGVNLSALKNVTALLAVGKNSPFVPTQDGGMVVHLLSRTPVDAATMRAELPAFRQTLVQDAQRDAFGDWLRREIEHAQVSLPRVGRQAETEPAAGQ